MRKLVYAWDPNEGESGDWSSTADVDLRFVYHQGLLLVSFDGLDSNAKVHKFVWGPDQSPKRERGVNGAGGANLGHLLATRDCDGSTDYVCFNNGKNSVGQLVDRSDASVDAKYGYDGPRDRAITDPCLDQPESFDDCEECTGPCFLGFSVSVRGLPEPHGVLLTMHRLCSCGPSRSHPGGCAPGSICGPGCPSGRCDRHIVDPPDDEEEEDPCPPPQVPWDCERCYGPCPEEGYWEIVDGRCECKGGGWTDAPPGHIYFCEFQCAYYDIVMPKQYDACMTGCTAGLNGDDCESACQALKHSMSQYGLCMDQCHNQSGGGVPPGNWWHKEQPYFECDWDAFGACVAYGALDTASTCFEICVPCRTVPSPWTCVGCAACLALKGGFETGYCVSEHCEWGWR